MAELLSETGELVLIAGLVAASVAGALAYAFLGRVRFACAVALVVIGPVVVALVADAHRRGREAAAPTVAAKAYDPEADAYLVTLNPGGERKVESWQFDRARVGEKYLPGERPRRRTISGAGAAALSGGR